MELPINLRQLRHLVLLADELHFGKAAALAFLSQSAFSRSIQSLEEIVGLRLFDRGLRRVRPTPVGERVIARARHMLASSTDLSRELSLLRSGDLGDVAAGAGPYSGTSLLPGPIASLQRDHPNIRVHLDVSDRRTLMQHLEAESIDFFVSEIEEVPTRQDLAVRSLGRLVGGMYCRAEHPLLRRGPLTMVDLVGSSFSSVYLPGSLRTSLAALIGNEGELPIALECENTAILREHALRSDVVMLATDAAVRVELESGLLHKLEIAELSALNVRGEPGAELGIVRLHNRTPTPASQLLIALVCLEAKKTLQQSRPPQNGRQTSRRRRARLPEGE